MCTYVTICSSDICITFLICFGLILHACSTLNKNALVHCQYIRWCGLHADCTHTHKLFCWAAMPASSPLLSHTTHSRHVHAHYHAGRCLWPAALCMELRGARPVECEREAQERATLSDTCQHSHTTSPWTSNTRTHTRTHTHPHTHTRTQCTYSDTSLSSLTNLYTDSLTRSLSDKSQCDLFRVSIPLFVNWLR